MGVGWGRFMVLRLIGSQPEKKMKQDGGAVVSLVSEDLQDTPKAGVQVDPKSISKHHRKLKSLGGGWSRRNISLVPLDKHRAWHALYRDMEPCDMIPVFKEDYEVFGKDVIKTELMQKLHEGWANSTSAKIKRREAWYFLFENMTLEEVVAQINTIWLDPDYEILIGMVRVKTVQLSETALKKNGNGTEG